MSDYVNGNSAKAAKDIRRAIDKSISVPTVGYDIFLWNDPLLVVKFLAISKEVVRYSGNAAMTGGWDVKLLDQDSYDIVRWSTTARMIMDDYNP